MGTKLVLQIDSSTQPTTCSLKPKLPHCPTSTHGQRTTGSPPSLMQTTPELPTTSQSTASPQDTAVSPPTNKLLRPPSLDHNQSTRLVLPTDSSIRLTTCSFKNKPLHC